MKKTNSEERVLIGKVGSPSGLRGEVRITLYQQDSTNLKEGKVLLLKHGKGNTAALDSNGSRSSSQNFLPARRPTDNFAARGSYTVEHVRFQKDRPVVKLEGIDDRNAAEELRNMEVFIKPEDLEPLPEGEHYVRDLIGCLVVDIAGKNDQASRSSSQNFFPARRPTDNFAARGSEEREVGTLRDVIQNTAQSILEVETAEGKTVLIPAVDEFLKEIDEEERIIKVKLIPGFIE